MKIYKTSLIMEEEFDFKNIISNFKNPFDYARSKYETLMNSLSDKIQHLPESKEIKYT